MRYLLTLALLFTGAQTLADAHAAGPSIVESFTCEYTDGKDADDLLAAVEYQQKQVDKIDDKDLNAYFAALLFPFRATVPTPGYDDFGWIGYWPNLAAMGRGLTAYYGSDAGQAADARMASVSTCRSNTWFRTPLIDNFPEDDATPESDAVELYFCTLREGTDMAAIEAAEAGFVAANGSAPIATDRWMPFLANTPLDLIYLVAHADVSSFADFNTGWQFSETGQANLAQFNEIMNCESGIFTGRIVHEPDE